MRGIRRFAAVLAIGAAVLVTPLTAAADGTTIAGATLATDKTSVSGTDVATLTVTLHLTDPNGVQPETGDVGRYGQPTPAAQANCPCALLKTTDNSGPAPSVSAQGNGINWRVATLTLTSGSATDGFWTGHAMVGAAGHGHWQLEGVIAGTLQTQFRDQRQWQAVDGSQYDAGVDISGSHWPVLAVAASPSAVLEPRSYVVQGQAVFSDTGEPVADLPISVQSAYGWPFVPSYVHAGQTDAQGHWSVTIPGTQPALSDVAAYETELVAGPGDGSLQYTFGVSVARVCCQYAVSARWSRSGTTRYITARIAGDLPSPLQPSFTLLRYDSAHKSWQQLVTRHARDGSFTFSTHTPGRYVVRASMFPVPGLGWWIRSNRSPYLLVR